MNLVRTKKWTCTYCWLLGFADLILLLKLYDEHFLHFCYIVLLKKIVIEILNFFLRLFGFLLDVFILTLVINLLRFSMFSNIYFKAHTNDTRLCLRKTSHCFFIFAHDTFSLFKLTSTFVFNFDNFISLIQRWQICGPPKKFFWFAKQFNTRSCILRSIEHSCAVRLLSSGLRQRSASSTLV